MKIKIIGKQKINFNADNGQHIEGTNIFWNESIPSSYGEGFRSCKKFLSPQRFSYDQIPVGDVDVEVGFSGEVLSIVPIK